MADDNIPTRLALLEQIASSTRDALARIEGRMDHIDARLDRLGNRVAALTGITSILGVAIIAILISQGALWQQMGRLDGQMTAIGAQVSEIATMLRSRTGG